MGVVTKPGLGLEPGAPAINPVPRQMITQAVGEVVDLAANGIEVVISVPDGERMARKTTNARLGILGGISILGTTGIVRPFSTASWRASVEQAISVLAAQGEDTVVLCTGGRTEKGAMALLPQLPEVCFVEVGDFTGAALRQAAEHGVDRRRLRRHGRQAHQAGQRGPDDPLHALQGRPRPAQRHHPRRRAARQDLAERVAQRQHRPARRRTLGRSRPPPRRRPRAVRPDRPRAQPLRRRGQPPRQPPRRPGPAPAPGPGPRTSASSWSTSPARPRSPRPPHESRHRHRLRRPSRSARTPPAPWPRPAPSSARPGTSTP